MNQYRTWGDGRSSKGAHLIADISFADGVAICSDGESVVSARGLTLEDAWDVHRGRPDLVSDRLLDPETLEQANDDEVGAFLALVADPAYAFEVTE